MWISKKNLNPITLVMLLSTVSTLNNMMMVTVDAQQDDDLCDTDERAFNIDFGGAIVTTNTLHQLNGELRYENLGSTFNGQQIDFA